MKLVYILSVLMLLSNCSLNSDSKFWSEDLSNKNKSKKKITNVPKNISFSTKMSFDEFNNYIDGYVKKSKYPDINQ
jgi:hypothetical protein